MDSTLGHFNQLLTQAAQAINDVVWSPALVWVCLGAGLYFSLRTRFLQVRHFGEMVRLAVSGKSSAAGVSSFQAFAMALSGRVGTGNIAGVATAIGFGGPGAVFWMWLVAFLGAGTAYVESTLAQIYKEENGGQFRGGPAFYIEKGIGKKWFAWTFALVTVIANGVFLPGVQSNSIATAVHHAFAIPTWITAAGIALLLGVIIFGGVRRIARFAELVVPFMALGYVGVAVLVMALNFDKVPAVFGLIFRSAFGMDAAFGGVLGLAIQWGVKRGIYSNEAGQGSGPHPAAAAEVAHPAQQGFVQALSVYIDTLVVCSATAFMVIVTGAYNVRGADGRAIVENLPGVEAGPAFTQHAIEGVLPGFGASFVAIALFFFAFTTLVAYYYMAETNIAYINRRLHRPWMVMLLRLVLLGATVYSAVRSANLAWTLGDIGVGLMAWLNLVAIFWLQRPALAALRDYEAQRRAGGLIVFEPRALGITGAGYWERRADGRGTETPPAEASTTELPQAAGGR